ncbi:MAG: hypothetical protein Q8K26_02530, partial [Candidatus Gracilibacteria bacterium]|nr:hypothetical protein [Candidatus Gracilibacteria bacterium]
MTSSLPKYTIPKELYEMYKNPNKSSEDIEKIVRLTRQFVENLLAKDFTYDIDNDPGYRKFRELVQFHHEILQRRAPENIGLLDTRTYKNLKDYRNPQVVKKLWAFGFNEDRLAKFESHTPKKESEKRLGRLKERHQEAYMEWLRTMLLIDQ